MAQLLQALVLGDQRARLRVVYLELRGALSGNKRQLPAEDTPLALGGVGQLLTDTSLARREPRPPAVISGVSPALIAASLLARRPVDPVPHHY